MGLIFAQTGLVQSASMLTGSETRVTLWVRAVDCALISADVMNRKIIKKQPETFFLSDELQVENIIGVVFVSFWTEGIYYGKMMNITFKWKLKINLIA